jgi:hypothetical protein
MPENLRTQLDRIDALIRVGNREEAVTALSAHLPTDIPRNDAVYFASLCRRAGRPVDGMRALYPFVSEEIPSEPSASELEEYAACLIRIGATHEALQILETLNAPLSLDAMMLTVYAFLQEWRHEEAIPLLRAITEQNDIPNGQRLALQVNLAAALVIEGRTPEAHSLVGALLAQLETSRNPMLRASLLSQSARAHILNGKWKLAAKGYEEAAEIVAKIGLKHSLLHVKWTLQSRIAQGKAPGPQMTKAFKSEILQAHGESLREVDWTYAMKTGDIKSLTRLYFGAAQPRYRTLLLSQTKSKFRIPEHYGWKLSPAKATKHVEINGSEVTVMGKKPKPIELQAHQVRVLKALCSDFYCPVGLGKLFEAFSLSAPFDPEPAAESIGLVVSDLNDIFRRQRLGIKVKAFSVNRYGLTSKTTSLKLHAEDLIEWDERTDYRRTLAA